MIAASARLLAGVENCFVGVGLPNIVCNLAQRTVAPELQLVYESGVFGARPRRLPLSIGDPTLATGSTAVTSMFELFAFYLQAGLIDVAFLGGAQIDRFGNLNTTVIGDYDHPKVRLPGLRRRVRDRDPRPEDPRDHAPGGAVVRREAPLPHVAGSQRRSRARPGARLVGERPDERRDRPRHLRLRRGDRRDDPAHDAPGRHASRTCSANMAWEPRVAPDLAETPPPTADELRLLREELDPGRIYTK